MLVSRRRRGASGDSSEVMRRALDTPRGAGRIILEYIDGNTRQVYTPLDGTYALKWRITKNATTTVFGMAGVAVVEMFRAWDDTDASVTLNNVGSWATSTVAAALGGSYRQGAGVNWVEFTVTDLTELWIAHPVRTNATYCKVTINGGTALVNELPDTSGERRLQMYAAADDHNTFTKVASGLDRGTTYTVRLTGSNVAGAGGGTFFYFSGWGMFSSDMTDARVAGTTTNNFRTIRTLASASHTWEYAYEIKPPTATAYEFTGSIDHGNEAVSAQTFTDQDGAALTVDGTTKRAIATRSVVITQTMTTRHSETSTTDHANVSVVHTFSDQGLNLWHSHTWLTACAVQTAYPAMFACDDSVTRGQVAGDTGAVYTLESDDDSQHGKKYARCAALWHPDYPYVAWLYMPDYRGVNGFAASALKLWIQDRGAARPGREKIYYTRASGTGAAETTANGDVWENLAYYRVSRVTPSAVLPR